jgi:PAS domain S-box-containing protein
VNPQEKQALDAIEQVISNYSSVAGLVETMVRDGKSAREIDRAIIVDDTLALRALKMLQTEIVSAHKANGDAVTASVNEAARFVMSAAAVAGILLLLLVIDSFWFTRTRISKPLLTLAEAMKELAAGDTSVDVPGLSQQNEIGEMAASVQVFRENAIRRKEAEKALQQSEQRFRTLVEYAADAIFVHDLDRNFSDVNQRACESLGYTREELLSMNVYDIDLNIQSQGGRPEITNFPLGETRVIESVHTRKDDTSFPVEIRTGKIEIDGETLIVSLARDMTAHKEAEAKTQQAMAEAEAASRAKSEFLSNMSHELRSPLNSVVGFSDLLIRDSSDKLTRNLAPKIRESGVYLTNLIEDQLDFDRIESGKVVLSQEDIPINDLVKSVIDAAAPQISGAVPLTLDLSMSAGNLMCDPIRIRLVLTNLLDNAVKYSPNGGKSTFRPWPIPTRCG